MAEGRGPAGCYPEQGEVDIQLVMEGNFREADLANLLDTCFPETFEGRTYFKQLPHARLIVRQPNLVAQVGLDLRICRVGSELLRILGVIDLCVAPGHRNQGLARRLLQAAEATAADWGAEFVVLFADSPRLYQRNGYISPDPAQVTWLGIEDRASCGQLHRDLTGTLWCKSVTGKMWPAGSIDLLGYLF